MAYLLCTYIALPTATQRMAVQSDRARVEADGMSGIEYRAVQTQQQRQIDMQDTYCLLQGQSIALDNCTGRLGSRTVRSGVLGGK
jgi:hypothetical protein